MTSSIWETQAGSEMVSYWSSQALYTMRAVANYINSILLYQYPDSKGSFIALTVTALAESCFESVLPVMYAWWPALSERLRLARRWSPIDFNLSSQALYTMRAVANYINSILLYHFFWISGFQRLIFGVASSFLVVNSQSKPDNHWYQADIRRTSRLNKIGHPRLVYKGLRVNFSSKFPFESELYPILI